MDLGQVIPLVLLTTGDMRGLLILYGAGVFVLAATTLPLLRIYVYSANRTLAQVSYVAALMIVFPGIACLGNHSVPPDYVAGFREIAGYSLLAFEAEGGSIADRAVTFLIGLPVPLLAACVLGAPFLRPRLIAPKRRRDSRRAR